GRPLAEAELQRSLVELGFDSLALTQLSHKVNQAFAVRIPYRRFYEELGTPLLLAAYLAVESKELAPLPGPKLAQAASQPVAKGPAALSAAWTATGMSSAALSSGGLSSAGLSS